MKKLIAFALAAMPALAGAETITFEADSEILTVRKTQRLDQTLVELIGQRDGSILCIALADDGTPLATTTGFAELGRVSFRDLDVTTVDRVVCRYN